MAIQSPTVDVAAALVRPTVASASRGYWPSVGRRLRRDPVTLICAGVLLLIVLSSIAAPLLGLADPYKTSMIRRLSADRTRRAAMSLRGQALVDGEGADRVVRALTATEEAVYADPVSRE